MATQWSRKELSQMPRAWKVSSLDEEQEDIVYARNHFEAAREGASAFGLCADEVTVKRDPDFDDLRGRSLWQAQLEAGWWFGCHAPRCERRVSLEGWDPNGYDDEEDEDEDSRATTVVIGEWIYCSPECVEAEKEYHADARRRKWAAVEAAVAKWPGITITGWHGNCFGPKERWESDEKNIKGTPLRSGWREPLAGAVDFTFPGGKYPACWTMGGDLHVSRCDFEAWKKFSGEVIGHMVMAIESGPGP